MMISHWRRSRRILPPTIAAAMALVAISGTVRGDQVVLKNGGLIRGIVERDNANLVIYDGLKRTVIRNTKVDRVAPEPASARQELERFSLVQPLEVHGGEMPSNAVRIRTTLWDELGRRMFEYSRYAGGRSLRTERMKQAINEIGPDVVRYRGIDGFWLGQVATSQVPREVILALLDRVDPGNMNERLRVGRFLIQVQWYDEALAELDRLAAAFPELKGTVATVRSSIRDLQAQRVLDDAARLVAVGQPRAAEELLTTFDPEGVSASLRDALDRRLRDHRSGLDAHRALASDLRAALDASSEDVRRDLRDAIFELLQAFAEVPDVVAPRLSPARQAIGAAGSEVTAETRLGRALSSWVVGPEHTTDDLATAEALWHARDRILTYLALPDASGRERMLAELHGLSIPGRDGGSAPIDLETASQIIKNLPPPLRGQEAPTAASPMIHRVVDDLNETPTEYAVLLPPEYHPLRPYPALVALHDGRGARSALDWWGPEAARNGFIVIAPEYGDESETPDYRYTPDEHAAVLLALRDARKRFSVDPDRVFVGGSQIGGNASWDVGLAHPDIFAGIVTLSGLPAKYVARTRAHAAYVPLYVVIGDLATGSSESTISDMVKAMISKAWDVTYVEYFRRGLEPLPEELPAAFDWMMRRSRTPYRKDFEVVACRTSDDRYHGLVIRDFVPGRTPAPETVDVLGSKLDPATIVCKTSTMSNLLNLTVSGINALDVWLSPESIDFEERIQIRVNGKRLFYDRVTPDLGALLEDVRVRGDRGQFYWAKLPLGGKRPS